jgi:hypothetical protein
MAQHSDSPAEVPQDRRRTFYVKVEEQTASKSKGVAINLAPRPFLPKDRVMLHANSGSKMGKREPHIPTKVNPEQGEDQLDLFFCATDLDPEQVIEIVELSTAYKPTVE